MATCFNSSPYISTSSRIALGVKERQGIAFGLVAATIWGGYIATTASGVDKGLSAPDLAFIRYTVAGLILLPWLLRHKPATLAGVGWSRAIVLALLAGPPFVIIGASGFSYAPVSHSAIIQLGGVTLVGFILTAWLSGRLPGRSGLIGAAVIGAGITATVLHGFSISSAVWRGDLLFFTAGTMWALFSVVQRQWGVAALPSTVAVSVLSAVLYSPAYLVIRGTSALARLSLDILIGQALVLGVLSGIVALFAFSRAVELLGPAKAAAFPVLSPVIATAIGVLLTGQWPDASQMVGLGVLSFGLYLTLPPTSVSTSAVPQSACFGVIGRTK